MLLDKIKDFNTKLAFTEKERMKLYRVLGGYIKSGKTATEAVQVVGRRNAKRGTDLVRMFDDVELSLANGNELSTALQRWIPNNEYLFITSGERGGVIQESLEELESMTVKMRDLKSSTVSKLSAPIGNAIITLIVIIGFATFIAPKLQSSLDMEIMPSQTQIFFSFTTTVSSIWWLILLIIFAIVAAIVSTLPSWTGSVRSFVDKLPPWSLYRTKNAAQFLISTAAMLKTGISVKDAIEVAGSEGSPWLAAHADTMLLNMANGEKTANAIDVGLLPRNFADEVIDFGDTSSFEDALMYAGRQAIDEVSLVFDRFTTIAARLSNVVLFGFVLALLGAILGLIQGTMASVAM